MLERFTLIRLQNIPLPRETNEKIWVQDDASSTSYRNLGFTGSERLDGLMQGNKTGRAASVNGHARTLQVVKMRYPIRQHCRAVSCHERVWEELWISQEHLGIVLAEAPGEHRGIGPGKALNGNTSWSTLVVAYDIYQVTWYSTVFDCFIYGFKDQS